MEARSNGHTSGCGGRPCLKRILCFAASAFAMPQNAVNDARICNKGDDARAATTTTQEGIGLEDFLDQAGPGAAGFPGAIRIITIGWGIT